MSSFTPSLHGTIRQEIDYYMGDVYTAIPALVINVRDAGELRVNVKPVLNKRSKDGTTVEERVAILNVPLQQPVSTSGGLTFPINSGDPVFLIFSMRGLELWKRGDGKPHSPNSPRMFDSRDCFAIPGVFPFKSSPNLPPKRTNSHNTEDVVLVHNIGKQNEVEIRLTKSGSVVINTNDESEVVVNAGNVKVNSSSAVVASDSFEITSGTFSLTTSEGATFSTDITMNGSFSLNGVTVEDHDHGGVQPGSGRTLPFGN